MKTVFITGAAHGIGRATARLFASEGWYIGLYDIDDARPGRTRQGIGCRQVLLPPL